MILDGLKVKEEILNNLKKELTLLNKILCLTVIEISNNISSNIYLKQKEKMCNQLGYIFNHIKLDESVKEEEVIELIESLNNDDNVDGILLQFPIAKHLNYYKIKNIISPLKDVDGLTDINIGKLVNNIDTLIPCTAEGIIELLKFYNIEIIGKNITIIGRSEIVGKPLAILLTNNDATVTLCHSKSNNLKEFMKQADILISAVGKPNFIKSKDIKNRAIIIDVGINKLENGKICGDVDYEDVKDKIAFITPVPGGVGPMTIAMLAKNIYKAYKIKNKIN